MMQVPTSASAAEPEAFAHAGQYARYGSARLAELGAIKHAAGSAP
jgi:hypothetical protein